jgi:hypothetical protein
MSPLEEYVLDILGFKELDKINFAVGQVHVCGQNYRKVADFIRNGKIQLNTFLRLDDKGVPIPAYYLRDENTLNLNSLTLGDIAQILHECTHAISDIYGLIPLRLADEATAYLAQFTYLKILNPTFPKYEGKISDLSPVARLMIEGYRVVQKHNLHKGKFARLEKNDIDSLISAVRGMPDYKGYSLMEFAPGFTGVPNVSWRRQIVIIASQAASRTNF